MRDYNTPVLGDQERLKDIASCLQALNDLEKSLLTWGDHWKDYLESQIRRQKIALAGLQGKPVVPEGWKLVPIEATPDMLNASWAHHGIYHPSAYRTMLAASPDPGGDRG